MPNTLVECVPNFSEGRDAAKVDAIVEAMKLPGVYLLDREMDADHNRCVITLVGEREAIQEAAIRGVGKAAELIDLNHHQGAHPRMGAADVVPFIPIERRHARRLRGHGAPRGRRDLEALRHSRVSLRSRGHTARTAESREHSPRPVRGHSRRDRHQPRAHARLRRSQRCIPPPAQPLVGARKFLIAYNVFLNTTDIEIAKKIAKAVRFSSGGLRYVKGAGFLVRGLAQVSMNLTDFEQTPIHRVFEFVRREAARYGVAPVSSEIVGLIPKLALERAAEWYLQVENFDSSLILENRLADGLSGKAASGSRNTTLRGGVEPFIEQLAAPTATPGGGSAAAASAAMAAGLAAMVASMSRGKKAYLQHDAALGEAIARLTVLREELKAAIDADAESYNSVMKAYRAAKESPEGGKLINAALKQATSVPLGVAERAAEIAGMVDKLRPITNPNMASDLTTAHALARAAIEGALANVEINLGSMKPETQDEKAFVSDRQALAEVLKRRL